MTLPDQLTLARALAVPVVVVLFAWDFSGHDYWATAVFAVAMATDQVDGWLARRRNQTSAFGSLLDPIADKVLVLAALVMLIGEGVFTTLSASEWFGLPAWALMSTRNLRVWSPPEGVRSVLIAADRGRDGEASAARLQGRLVQAGLAATIALPPAPFGDWNEWSDHLRRSGRRQRRGEEGIGRARPGAG